MTPILSTSLQRTRSCTRTPAVDAAGSRRMSDGCVVGTSLDLIRPCQFVARRTVLRVRGDRGLRVARDRIDFEVDLRAGALGTECRPLRGLGNECDRESARGDRRDGEADAVDRDVAFFNDVRLD